MRQFQLQRQLQLQLRSCKLSCNSCSSCSSAGRAGDFHCSCSCSEDSNQMICMQVAANDSKWTRRSLVPGELWWRPCTVGQGEWQYLWQCLVKFWNFIYSSAGLFHCAWACKSLPAFGKSTNRGKRAKVFRKGALQELKVLTRSLNLSGDCTSKARVAKQLAIKVVN